MLKPTFVKMALGSGGFLQPLQHHLLAAVAGQVQGVEASCSTGQPAQVTLSVS